MKRTAEYNQHKSDSDNDDDYSKKVSKRYAGVATNKSVFKETFTKTWPLPLGLYVVTQYFNFPFYFV